MTLQQLTYLVAIYEEGTISGAARELNVSQPTVTQSLRDLERDLDVKLLERNAGPGELKFTPKGEEIVGRAIVVLKAAEALRQCARSKRVAPKPGAMVEEEMKRDLERTVEHAEGMESKAKELIASMQASIIRVKKQVKALDEAARYRNRPTISQTKKRKKGGN